MFKVIVADWENDGSPVVDSIHDTREAAEAACAVLAHLYTGEDCAPAWWIQEGE
jgi:hypothetical protein